MIILKSLLIFFLAGLCEIGEGYFVWLWLKADKPWWVGVLGAVTLFLYGVLATLQLSNFGRVYAAYGSVFILMAVLWGWKIDMAKPDKYDLIGAAVALLGMAIILFAPRK